MLKDFVDGNFECFLYILFRPNQEQQEKYNYTLWQESNLRPCDSGAAL